MMSGTERWCWICGVCAIIVACSAFGASKRQADYDAGYAAAKAKIQGELADKTMGEYKLSKFGGFVYFDYIDRWMDGYKSGKKDGVVEAFHFAKENGFSDASEWERRFRVPAENFPPGKFNWPGIEEAYGQGMNKGVQSAFHFAKKHGFNPALWAVEFGIKAEVFEEAKP